MHLPVTGADSGPIYAQFIERAIKRVQAVKQGHPLDTETMIGAQASSEQMEKILSYLDIGRQEGAECLTDAQRYERRAVRILATYPTHH